jgi:hypothetical protein
MQRELGMTMQASEKAWFEKFYAERDAWWAAQSVRDRAYFKRDAEYAQYQANMDEQRSAAQ